MKKVILYYFSGTGNTERIVMQVKRRFEIRSYECSIKSMEEKVEPHSEVYEYIGLLFPVAIQSTFPLVWKFIEDFPSVKNQKIFMVDTMEVFSGGIVGPVRKVLELKGMIV